MRFLVIGFKDRPSILDLGLSVLGAIPCIFIVIYWEPIVSNPLSYETYHLVLGAILFVMLMEATRRTLGNIVPVVVSFFVLYALFGHLLPGELGHAGYGLEELLYIFYLTTEGVWGLLTDLTSRLIAIFILLGPILFACGVGNTFVKWSRFTGGRIRGGAGQIALLSSAGLGMLSGSSVANVATTGTFTIPTMKKLGYKDEIAAATEASASSGGQIMPPIMGAGAFVMAELLGMQYTEIMVASIIPAVCYFVGIGSGVYILAGKYGLGKLPAALIPKWKELFNPAELLNTIIPVGLLIYLLVIYMPPQSCAGWALVSSLAIFLFFGGAPSKKAVTQRVRTSLAAFYRATNGALVMLIVMMSCVQVVVTLINATGLGVKISEFIVGLAGTNSFLALIAVMVVAIVLGMGMSTTARLRDRRIGPRAGPGDHGAAGTAVAPVHLLFCHRRRHYAPGLRGRLHRPGHLGRVMAEDRLHFDGAKPRGIHHSLFLHQSAGHPDAGRYAQDHPGADHRHHRHVLHRGRGIRLFHPADHADRAVALCRRRSLYAQLDLGDRHHRFQPGRCCPGAALFRFLHSSGGSPPEGCGEGGSVQGALGRR